MVIRFKHHFKWYLLKQYFDKMITIGRIRGLDLVNQWEANVKLLVRKIVASNQAQEENLPPLLAIKTGVRSGANPSPHELKKGVQAI